MSLGLIPVFDREFPHDTILGELLCSALDDLEAIANAARVRPLSSFHGWVHIEIPEDYDGDPRDLWVGPPQWHDAAELHATLGLIRTRVTHDLASDHPVDEVLAELNDLDRSVLAAIERNARVYLHLC